MDQTVSDHRLDRLHARGGRRTCGYPGDGFIGASGRQGDLMRFVEARHGERAALMACARARSTGDAGACLATAGPGANRRLAGSPAAHDLPYAACGRLPGLAGLLAERPEDVAATWVLPLSGDRPGIVGGLTDRKVPPTPPHVTRKQASSGARALVIALLRETRHSLFPGSTR